MGAYPRIMIELIDQFSRLPGVGRRSAERMVFWLLNSPGEEARRLAEGIGRLKERLGFCRECRNLSEAETCPICADPRRDRRLLCVVENPKDLIAIERTGVYKGLYHVLLGAMAPTEGRGPKDLRVDLIAGRVRALGVREVILATDPDTEGEMTAMHIADELRPLGVRISRIGVGIPMGSAVEYADLSTLSASMAARRTVEDR